MLSGRFCGTTFVAIIGLTACGGDSNSDVSEDVIVLMPSGQQATVKQLDASEYPSQELLLSPVFDIGPSATFDVPVTIGLPINPDTPAGTAVVLMRYDEASSAWQALKGSHIVGTTVFAQTDHFSVFAALSNAQASACDNLWSGGPGTVAPFLVPGNISVSPATRTEEVSAFSGDAIFAQSSTWESDECSVTVTGEFGGGTAGSGLWVDYSKGGGGDIPQGSGGSFSFTLQDTDGPFLGLADPCNAPLGGIPYHLNVHMKADCVDKCLGVTCTTDDGNPCTTDTCNGQTGLCEQTPNASTCGSASGGKCVLGACMVEVPMLAGVTGNSVCAAEGLSCNKAPVLAPPEAACLAFHPGASVSASASGWRQGIYCNDNDNTACSGRLDTCHSCPACLDTGITCLTSNSTQLESAYVSCI